MKIIISADWHIGNTSDSWITKKGLPSKVEETFKQIDFLIDYAIKNKIKRIKLAGDLYHYNRPIPKYERMFIKRLNRLEEAGIAVDIFKGNHEENTINEDALSPLTQIKYKHIKIFKDIVSTVEGGINWIYIPHISKTRFGEDATEEMVTDLIKEAVKRFIKRNRRNIILGHFHAAGAITGTEQHMLRGGINFMDGKGIKINRMYLGHIHKHQNFKSHGIPCTYVGDLIKNDFGEEKEDKGFIVYDTEKDKHQFIKNDTRQYKTINIDLVKKNHIDLDSERIKKAVKGKIVKLKITVLDQNKDKLNITEIEDAFSEYSFVARKEIVTIESKNEIRKYDGNLNPVELLEDHIEELAFKDKLQQSLIKKGKEIILEAQPEENQAMPNIGKIHLEKLVLHNFRCFKDVEIDLSKISIAGIIGTFRNNETKSNGSGKTSLLTAIPYILFGKYKTLSEVQLVSNNETEMEATLILSANKKRVKITRIKKKSTNSLELSIGGKNVSGKKSETQDLINNLIGMDYNLFIATVFFLEKESDNFCVATPAIRKEYLRELLQLRLWDEGLRITKARHVSYQNEVDALQTVVDITEERIEGMNIDKIQRLVEKAEAAVPGLDEQISEVDEKIAALRVLKNNQSDLKETKEELEEEISDASGTIINCSSSIDDIKEDIEGLKKLSTEKLDKDLKKHQDSLNQIIENRGGAAYAGTQLAKDLKEMKEMKEANCSRCGQSISAEYKSKTIKRIEKELEEARAAYRKIDGSFSTTQKIIRETKKAIDVINKNNKKLSEAKQEIDRLNKSIAENEEKVEGLKEKLQKVNSKLKSAKKFDGKKLSDLESQKFSYGEKLSELNESIGKYKQQIKSYLSDKKKLQEKELQLKKKSAIANQYKILVSVFGKNGVSSRVIADSLKEIKEHANEILNDIDNGEKKILFETLKESKKELKDSLDIFIEDKEGHKRKYETYSGGESTLINFSIRLALSYMLSKRNNVWHGVIVLDEVMGTLDESNREKIIKVINYLRKYFKQIFIISHTDIKDAFDSIIWIEKNNKTNISKVKKIV